MSFAIFVITVLIYICFTSRRSSLLIIFIVIIILVSASSLPFILLQLVLLLLLISIPEFKANPFKWVAWMQEVLGAVTLVAEVEV